MKKSKIFKEAIKRIDPNDMDSYSCRTIDQVEVISDFPWPGARDFYEDLFWEDTGHSTWLFYQLKNSANLKEIFHMRILMLGFAAAIAESEGD